MTRKLLVKDFSVQAHTEFDHPIFETQADLPALTQKMLQAFSSVLRPDDIDLATGRQPFGYRLTFKMFNGSADVIITSRTVTSSFRDGRNSQALNLVSKSIEAICNISVTRSIVNNQLLFATHSQFESADAYEAYMAQFVNNDHGFLSGGKILQADARNFKGELRYSTEKSVVYENSIYILSHFFTKELLKSELLEKMAVRFKEISAVEGFDIILPDTEEKAVL